MIKRHWPTAILVVGVLITLVWIAVLAAVVVHFASHLF
jgi:hypothetical protein